MDIDNLVQKDTEFIIQADSTFNAFSSGVYVKIEEITPDKIIVLKHNGIGPDEVTVPEERFIKALENKRLIPQERDSIQHD